jgi:trigger factor
MQIIKKSLPASRLQMTITLPWEDWQKEIEHASSEMAKNVKLPGFRKGKVPKEVVEQRFGREAVLAEAAEHAVSHSYPKVLNQEGVEAIGHPAVKLEALKEGEPLVYVVETDVMPTITLGDWKKAVKKINQESDKQKLSVDESEVEAELARLTEMRAPLITVNKEAGEGDTALVDFEVKQDGVLIEGGKSDNHPLVLGSNTFIPGFEEEVFGMEAGETKTFSLVFPVEYHAKHLAGKPAEFTVTLHAVQEKQLPELTDEFVKTLGKFETVEELKANIRTGIEEEQKAKSIEERRVKILDTLVGSTTIEYPEVLVHEEESRMLREFASQAEMMGMNFNDYLTKMGKTEDDVRKEWNPQAKKRIAAELVLQAVAKDEEIVADSEEIEEEINKTMQYYKNVEEAEKKIDLPRLYTAVREQLQNRKTLEYLETVK